MNYRVEARTHPYTLEGLQIDVRYGEEWIEVGECGLAHHEILGEKSPWKKELYRIGYGLGLDRILMIRKKMKDIRLVASNHPDIASQMKNLDPYRAVSSMPAVKRDLSLVLNEAPDSEEMGDIVRQEWGKKPP